MSLFGKSTCRRAVPGYRHLAGVITADRLSSARLCLVPLTVADAAEMVPVLSGAALYAFTGGSPPGLGELRARYTRQAAGHSPDARVIPVDLRLAHRQARPDSSATTCYRRPRTSPIQQPPSKPAATLRLRLASNGRSAARQ
jgi:hypothetical protein